MAWGRYDTEAAVERYDEFDRFRDSIAEAVDETGVVVGHVATTVSVGWNLVGWDWWRPRWGRPAEYIDVLFTPLEPAGPRDFVHELEYTDWSGKTFMVKGRVVQLRWLQSDDAERAWRRFGWDRDGLR